MTYPGPAAPAAGRLRGGQPPVPDPGRLDPPAWARDLEAVVWSLGMARQDPGRYRETADAWLTRMKASSGPVT